MNLREAASIGTGIPIRALQGDARSLGRDEFEDLHGPAFLLLTAASLTLPSRSDDTDVRLEEEVPHGESTARLRMIAFGLRARDGAPGTLVTLGRSSRSDVVVPDLSISRFHAFARQGPDGRWMMLDAGSTNGTTVDGRSAPQQGSGRPVELKAGGTVRLGQVELTFLDLDSMLAYLAKL